MRSVLLLTVLVIASPALGWRLVGLAGQRVIAITNAARDFCYAATESVVYRGDRNNWYVPVYRYGAHPGIRVRIKEGVQNAGQPVCLAWGWGSRSDGVWLSTDNGSIWHVGTYMLFPAALDAVWDYYSQTGLMLAGSDTLDTPPQRSTDAGTSWQLCGSGLPANQVRCFAINGDNRRYAVCGTKGHGLYFSQDTGASWRFSGPDSSADVLDATWLEGTGLVLAKVRDTTAVWSTDDTGRTWVRELLLPGGTRLSFNRACQVGSFGIYERGNPWQPDTLGLTCRSVRCISSTFHGAFWYAGTDSGVFHQDMTPGLDQELRNEDKGARKATLIVRGVLRLPASFITHHSSLITSDGRRVMDLQPGANDVRQLAPGVYFIGSGRSAVRRVIVVR
ncbi:MAG: hypothetical protein ABIK86_03015 [candidate division WOR-3 bacterium]